MEEKPLQSPAESMLLINEMIGKAKKSYITKGTGSILWGVLIIVCSMVTWSQIHFNYKLGFDIWLLLIVALAAQIYFGIKEKSKRQFETYDQRAMQYTWTAFGIAIFLVIFYQNNQQVENGTFLIMLMYGIPTFITGGLFRFKPMIFGGICCWVFAVITLYVNEEIQMLLMAMSGLLAWLIPGLILMNKYLQQKKTNV